MTKNTKAPIRPSILTIAASDSAGMAGIAQDVRTQTALGCHSLTVLTANTAQNNHEFCALNLCNRDIIESQLSALSGQVIEAVKIGLIASPEQVDILSAWIAKQHAPIVFDPVLLASSEKKSSFDKSIKQNLVLAIKQRLLPFCDLITPNILEAEQITNLSIRNQSDMMEAAKIMLDLGAKSVLIKGGHLSGQFAQDYYLDKSMSFWLTSRRIDSINTRGTGCALSSSIASALALGYSLKDSVVIGKMAINQGLRHGYSTELDFGPACVQDFPDKQIDLPWLTNSPDVSDYADSFLSCGTSIGIYPVVDRADWIRRLAPIGITTIQLRIKDLHDQDLEQEVILAIKLAQQFNCRLFINDHWQLAIKHKAYGVHLGQEDLDTADIVSIRNAELRLGISTHCHYEVARAHALKPSYLACGPVFETTSKKMPWIPQGIHGLDYWQKCLNYPLVAIGGINIQNIKSVHLTGVNGIAMISAITAADNPEATAQFFLQATSKST